MLEYAGSSAHLLIIDDDRLVLDSLKRILEGSGHQVSVASDGGDGLAFLEAQPVDLVLLDLKLPDMSGLEVLSRIVESYPHTPVLMITGHAGVESAVEAIRIGACDYVAKPCEPKELQLRIAQALERTRLQQELHRAEEIFQVLRESAFSVQKSRSLDEAFQCIGEQLWGVGMQCVVGERCQDSLDQLRIRYCSLPEKPLRQLEDLAGAKREAFRVPYQEHAALEETLMHGVVQWHPLERGLLQALVPLAREEQLDVIVAMLGESAWVQAPIEMGGEIWGILVVIGGSLTKKDIPLVATLAHQLSMALENVRWMEQTSHSERELKALSARLLSIQEEERRRISLDLHDAVGQALSAIKLDLELLRKRDGRVDEIKPDLEESIESLGMTMKELRNISADLRPAILDDLGLIPALRWYSHSYTPPGAEVSFSEDLGDEADLGKQTEIRIFRVVQEALSNAVRHSQAKHITVQVQNKEGAVHVVVGDDGVGFDARKTLKAPSHERGVGLISMRERARMSNAELCIESTPGQGTRISLRVPLETKGSGNG